MKIDILLIAVASVLCVSGHKMTIEESAFRTVSSAVNDFTHKFYKAVSIGTESNLICSPIGVDVVLSMTSFGARGNTLKQIKSSLNLSDNENITKLGLYMLIRSLNFVQGVELKLANNIYVDSGTSLQYDFYNTMRVFFKSETHNINFTNADVAAKTINDWSAEKTNNRITELFTPGEIEGALLVLVNALYFKGKWAHEFNPERTQLLPFYIDDKTTKEVPMMRRYGAYNYGYLPDSLGGARYIELPYEISTNKNEAISMYIFHPDQISGLRDLENNIHKLNYAELDEYEDNINLSLPKFKIKSKIDLEPTIINMGMNEIFENKADLSGMITGNTDLKVNKFIQKAFIEVNEEGSEAAAVTGYGAVTLSVIEECKVNSPFMYVIVKKSTRTPLFIGRVIDPTI